MNYVIHLTNRCNLKCKYCYEKKNNNDIEFENIKNIVNKEISQKSRFVNINFYGGEPLLRKDLIIKTIDYIKDRKKETKSETKFVFGITTNGTLLDKDFIKYMKNNNFVSVGYSFDGNEKSQNLNRLTIDDKSTFDIVAKNAKLLLDKFNKAVAMMVLTKNNLTYLQDNIQFLIKIGFTRINIQFDYKYDWQDSDIPEIRRQFEKVAEIYYENMMKNKDVDILFISEKIKTYVKNGYNCNDDCNFGNRYVNVGTNGNFYPCMQFVDNNDYIIGNCKEGIDEVKRQKIIKKSKKENETCKTCSIRNRCKHICPCKNYLVAQDANVLSPIICETERMMIDISDKIAEKLYKSNSKLFLKKYMS